MIVELKKHFGSNFETALLEEIAQVGTFRSVPAEVELMDIGQTIKGVPLMLHGAVKISREDSEGNELLLYYLEEGESCTMTFAWELGQQKSKIRAVTEMPSELIMVPLSVMENWSERYPSWRQFLFKSYQKRMDELLETLDSLAFDQLEKRLWNYLIEKKRVTKQTTLSITHQTIAQDLHSSRVVISRLLKRLENNQKISLHRNAIELIELV
ncbi:Crp/Fnr family transcriptional regulator [Flavobacteriaceae bacterium]|nr:Crp/Fnr family transcriptional regulator [Flavobacteriaceae bacterium]MDA9886042.1 Crp/Fnr family transcriptional regulator [Flavobacteriaceae bacterium]MDA9984942.1 Crp/Fnr family transcriptional regulator [Flavobacteriaceae bacterium]MDB2673209.1 Crp/Fnr family transcriptional regulator [Flavobacteriaceae bacterium]MDB4113121.1 Crp/Fnr family transcriptional regulator [Flavobacteriaceae bacterium]